VLPRVDLRTHPQATASGTNREPRLVHQYDEEYEEVKKTRRPGRPASAREDLLKLKISTLEKEHRDGFCKPSQSCSPVWPTNHLDLPDLTSETNVQLLARFEGSWTFLTTLAWVKLSAAGDVKPSSFPPQGL
jgi:translation machinery-associated protein 16